ncbi:MAG: hypothetical protein Q7K55_00890 [Candidatus Levybacteria bacterium]|nr:hypothetical protein [Candidatus Levybacteria bacterium]
MREKLNRIDLQEGLTGIIEGAIGAGFLIQAASINLLSAKTYETLYTNKDIVNKALQVSSDAGIHPMITLSAIAAASSLFVADGIRRFNKNSS